MGLIANVQKVTAQMLPNGRVYGKVGLKVLTYRATIKLIKSTKVVIWNDVPTLLYTLLGIF